MNILRQTSCCVALLASIAVPAAAGDIVNLRADQPEVRFDVPRSVVVRVAAPEEIAGLPALAVGERLVTVDLPVTVVVSRGEVDRVGEVVIEVDGAAAGLTVHDYSPATRLQSEYASEIEVQSTTESNHHLDGSLGGFLPNPGGAVAQLAPSISAGKGGREAETAKHSRLAPKEAIVVAGAINRRQGVLFKFRPSSQTTLEGERRLSITFVAPADWNGGELSVACTASGERKVLFVTKRKVWGETKAPVGLRLASSWQNEPTAVQPTAKWQRVAKPVVPEVQTGATQSDAASTPSPDGLLWKRRMPAGEVSSVR
ncbi:MAG: hypothetical protein AAGF31_04235 [Planctomycetota bacterium]